MPVVITTYTELVQAADQVKDLIADNSRQIASWKAQISSIVSSLIGIGNEYGSIVAAADAVLALDPADPAYIHVHSHVQKLLGNFTSQQTEAAALDVLVHPPPP